MANFDFFNSKPVAAISALAISAMFMAYAIIPASPAGFIA